ncbi:MAG: protein kinase [Acidobacteriota bacterium]
MISKIGKYEVLRKVGTGAWGSVYEARDPLIRRTVAVKTCEAKDPEVRARFFQEAQLGGSLRHRNITTVYDFGVDDGISYIVQEFLDGEDLDRIIARREALPLIEKLQILIGIAYGLEYAHNAGIVHRDVKPGNIRILSDGTVKLMDFGIAKLAATGHNRTGRNMGTLAYLAPERILEQPVDSRADIFSFGVVAYELLAGTRPFEGEVEEDLFNRIATADPIPLSEIAQDVPPALSSIVDRALRKNPDDRYHSVEPMRKALLAAFRSLYGDAVPAAADHHEASSADRMDNVPHDDAETRDLPGRMPQTDRRPSEAPDDYFPPPAPNPVLIRPNPPNQILTPESDPVLPSASRRSGLALAVLVSVAIGCAVVGILVWGGLALLRARPGAAANAETYTNPAPTSVPVSRLSPDLTARPLSTELAPAPSPAPALAPAPAPDTLARVPPPTPPVLQARQNTSPARQPAGAAHQVAARIISKSTSHYARAADEPGLSADTRAAIYLNGAWERYRAGDAPGARQMLSSAFALRRDLDISSTQYDAGFRRLAIRVRSERSPAS